MAASLGYIGKWGGIFPENAIIGRLPSGPYTRPNTAFQIDDSEVITGLRRALSGAPEFPLLVYRATMVYITSLVCLPTVEPPDAVSSPSTCHTWHAVFLSFCLLPSVRITSRHQACNLPLS